MSQYASEKVVKDIQHQILRTYCAKKNLRIVLDGLRNQVKCPITLFTGHFDLW